MKIKLIPNLKGVKCSLTDVYYEGDIQARMVDQYPNLTREEAIRAMFIEYMKYWINVVNSCDYAHDEEWDMNGIVFDVEDF